MERESVSSMVADAFREAKDAPTSFEDQQWIDGFQDARRIIAERIASKLTCLAMFSEAEFLTACDVVAEEVDDEDPAPKFNPGDVVYVRRIGRTRTVVSSERQYGHERRYVLRGDDGRLDPGWREDELELAGEVAKGGE